MLGTFEQSAAHGLTEVDLTRAPFQISVLGISTISKLLSEDNLHAGAKWMPSGLLNRSLMRGSGDLEPVESWHRAPTKGKAQPEVKAEVGEGVGGIKRTDGKERALPRHLAATAEHAQ